MADTDCKFCVTVCLNLSLCLRVRIDLTTHEESLMDTKTEWFTAALPLAGCFQRLVPSPQLAIFRFLLL